MEALKQKVVKEIKAEKEQDSKAIRISKYHSDILENGRNEINKDKTYTKKISFTRYVEKLIEDHWERPIESLKKEREGSRDWLELQHKQEAPTIPFYDWLRNKFETKQSKRSALPQKESK